VIIKYKIIKVDLIKTRYDLEKDEARRRYDIPYFSVKREIKRAIINTEKPFVSFGKRRKINRKIKSVKKKIKIISSDENVQ
jgi:hypothetical protein